MSKQAFKQFEDHSAMSEITRARDNAMEKMKFQEQKNAFDSKIQELATKAADFYQKYGEEDWRTALLVNFLDLSLQMKDVIEVITAFNVANEILFHSMNLMNTSLQMTSGMMMDMGRQQVNNPLKQKLMMRKAMRNNRATVKNMIDQMKTSIEMATMTAGMYEGLSESIAGILDKMNNKKKKKKQNAPSATAPAGKGLDMVKGILSEQGVAVPSTPAAPAASYSASSSGDSGLDGVL